VRIRSEESALVAISWALEWHGLTRTAVNGATAHYLHGCANVVMARSPLHAIEAIQHTQTCLLNHSAHVFAEVAVLWRRQSMALLVLRTGHQRTLDHNRSELGSRAEKLTNEDIR